MSEQKKSQQKELEIDMNSPIAHAARLALNKVFRVC